MKNLKIILQLFLYITILQKIFKIGIENIKLYRRKLNKKYHMFLYEYVVCQLDVNKAYLQIFRTVVSVDISTFAFTMWVVHAPIETCNLILNSSNTFCFTLASCNIFL